MSAKVFEVGDVLPAGIIEISVSKYHDGGIEHNLQKRGLKSDNNLFNFFTSVYIEDADWPSYYDYYIAGTLFGSCYDDEYGDTVHDWFYRIEIDTSDWSLSKRTISSVQWDTYNYGVYFTWEDITPSGYSITFEENGGSTVTDLTEQTNLPNPLPIPTRTGYTFNGWFYESNFTTQAQASDTLSANVTLYAKWTLNSYTITYNSNGGSSVSQVSGVAFLPSTLPTPTKSNLVFGGWFYESNFTTKALANDTLTSDVTLYAKWLDTSDLLLMLAQEKAKLTPNILKKGETVFGVTGTYEA